MSEPKQLDRAFYFIMKRMMETGQAPFYTEIAAELGVPVEEGRKVLHGKETLNPISAEEVGVFCARFEPVRIKKGWPLLENSNPPANLKLSIWK